MCTILIYIGIAIAILIASILVFKPEFSMITGSNTSGRIVGITQGGDIILSDNTVKNINDYISNMQSDLTKSINDTKTSLTQQIATAKSAAISTAASSASSLYQPKGDYLRNKDKVALGGTLSAAQCGGDCRAVTNMWNPNSRGWAGKPAWQWNAPGAIYYDNASSGKIYLIRAAS